MEVPVAVKQVLTRAVSHRHFQSSFGTGEFNPDSAVQSDTSIKRQALQSECNGPVACSGLQSPVLQRTPEKITSPGASTVDSIEIVRFCAFAPPGSPLD